MFWRWGSVWEVEYIIFGYDFIVIWLRLFVDYFVNVFLLLLFFLVWFGVVLVEFLFRLLLLVWWICIYMYEVSMMVEMSISIFIVMVILYFSFILFKFICIVVVLLEFIFFFYYKLFDDFLMVVYNSFCSYKKVKNKFDFYVYVCWFLFLDILFIIVVIN